MHRRKLKRRVKVIVVGKEGGSLRHDVNEPFPHTDGTSWWLHELKIEEVTYLRYQSIMGATLPVSLLSELQRVPNAILNRGMHPWRPPKRRAFLSVYFLFLCNDMLRLRVLIADPQPPSEYPRFFVPTSAAWHRVLARAQNASRKRSIEKDRNFL
ncbi:hypothetical protein ISCGN_005150 [Ixodes scapularis]